MMSVASFRRLALLLMPISAPMAAFGALPAYAQVTTNSDALEAISPAAPAAAASGHEKPAAHHAAAAKSSTRSTKETSAANPAATPASGASAATSQGEAASGGGKPNAAKSAPVATSGRPPPSPTIPLAPPPPPVLTPPPIPVELHPFPMPPKPTVVKDAIGKAIPITGGVRLTFAAGSTDLNDETQKAILDFVSVLHDNPDVRALVDAYASGAPNDPSRPRRMSLTRGLAVRSVLMNAGIPSTRIYVRVIGQPVGDPPNTPVDRVDIRRSDAVP